MLGSAWPPGVPRRGNAGRPRVSSLFHACRRGGGTYAAARLRPAHGTRPTAAPRRPSRSARRRRLGPRSGVASANEGHEPRGAVRHARDTLHDARCALHDARCSLHAHSTTKSRRRMPACVAGSVPQVNTSQVHVCGPQRSRGTSAASRASPSSATRARTPCTTPPRASVHRHRRVAATGPTPAAGAHRAIGHRHLLEHAQTLTDATQAYPQGFGGASSAGLPAVAAAVHQSRHGRRPCRGRDCSGLLRQRRLGGRR